MPQLLISEDELLSSASRTGYPLKDYSVKPLDDYSSSELIILNLAISIPYQHAKDKGQIEIMKVLDVWATRIKMAAEIAQKRELGIPF